jgi:hypothetical protein
MSILDEVLASKNGAAVQQLGAQFGLRPEQVSSALGALMPALAAGFQREMSTESGLAGLVSALSGGQHQRYLEDPAILANPATTADGNAILGHVFGSKEVSREVAAKASQRTGIDSATLKKMLPLVAAIAMAAMSRKTKTTGGAPSNPAAAGGGLASMLGPLLDRDRDGSMVDDVAGMIGGFLGRQQGKS